MAQARVTGDFRQEATLLNNLGTHHCDAGDNAQALEHYLQALRLLENIDYPNLRIKLLSNIGEVQLETRKLNAARASFEAALELSRTLAQPRDEGAALEILGEVYCKLGDDKRAHEHLQNALGVRTAIADKRGQATSHVKLAGFYAQLENVGEAEWHFGAAQTLAGEIEERALQAEALAGLGRLYLGNAPERALAYLLQSLTLATDLGLKRLLAEAHRALSETYEALLKPEPALTHFKKFHELVRQLTDERVAKHTARLTLQLELERAQKDAEIERLRLVELAQANARLKAKNLENARLLEELQRQAHEDPLTGLANRRSFSTSLAQSFEYATRHARPLAVAIADIDDFKKINDRFSHAAGDAVLKTVAAIFRRSIRGGDVVARMGGEEFAFVFPEADETEGVDVCERIRESVANYDWRSLHAELYVTLSIGLAWDVRVHNAEKMLAQADAQLYRAKRLGKNRIGGRRNDSDKL